MAGSNRTQTNTIKKKMQTLGRDNRGSAIVMVLVSMAFVGIMASMLMFVTYKNYKMKVTDYHAKDNFYSADLAMDEIRAGVQQTVYEAFSNAYQETMQIYANEEENNKNVYFKEQYINYIVDYYRTVESSEKYNLDLIKSYVSRPAVNKGDIGAYVDSTTCYLLKYEDGIRMKDIVVTYTDEQGYVSIIETDILLAFPELGIQASYEFPDLKQYCIIADKKFVVEKASNAEVLIKGSIYGGQDGMEIGRTEKVAIEGYDAVVNNTSSTQPAWAITDGNIVLGNKEDYNASQFSISEDVDLWAAGITLEGKRESVDNKNQSGLNTNLWLKGDTYLQDDLTINATGMDIKLAGTYTGFGNASNKAEDSSSIIINGLGTTLDMSALTKLSLGGNAYIATSDVPTSQEEKNKDIKMGNSVASKADQLAYLVPAECIGFDVENNQTVVGRNPVNVKDKEYQKFLTEMKEHPTQYKEVNLSVVDKNLTKSLSSYGATYEKVYYQVDSENIWVYYYLKFASSLEASTFFRDYYKNDKNQKYLNNYIDNYVEILNPGNQDTIQLNLVGNMVAKDNQGNYSFVDSTIGDDVEDIVSVNKEYAKYSNEFVGLCKKLTTNYGDLTGKERRAGVYYNIINKEYIQECKNRNIFLNKYIVFENSTKGCAVLLITEKAINEAGGNLTLEKAFQDAGFTTDAQRKNVNLVISEGNLTVGNIDFRGTIIVDGELTVNQTATFSVMLDMADVLLSSYKVDDDNEIKALSLFRDGKDTQIENGNDGDNQMTTGDLVLYENWTKR
ncbi:MAG: hypothetical protein IKW30_03285 [Lachnospiraceae bacterium]|nr:hypothetical protein [Lachnospiraceae bacterium]